jgi:MFS family permease
LAANHISPTASRPTVVRYSVLLWLGMMMAIAYVDRGVIGVAVTRIEADLSLDDDRMGLILSAFSLTYALASVPGAWLGQRWGNRQALTAFAALWSVATALCAAATGFYSLLFARLLMGAAEAGVVPCAAVTLSRWFPRRQRGWYSGILGCFMGIGGALGNRCGGELLAVMNWRWMFIVCSLPGFAWSAWFWYWFRDRPEQHRAVNRGELELIDAPSAREPAPAVAHELPRNEWMFWSDPTLWGLAGQQFFRAAAAVLFLTWFSSYLERTHELTVQQAGKYASLPLWVSLAGTCIGGLCSDWITNRTGSQTLGRKGFAMATTAGSSLCMLAAVWAPDLNGGLMMICLSTFVVALAGPTAYATSLGVGGQRAGSVFAVMNMGGNFGAMLFPTVMQKFVAWYGDWSCVPWFVACLLFLSSLCWLLVAADRPVGSRRSFELNKG